MKKIFSIIWRQIPQASNSVQYLISSLDQKMNPISKLKYTFPLDWILASGLVPVMDKGSIVCFIYSFFFFNLYFNCLSAFLSVISGFPWVSTLLGSKRGWSEEKFRATVIQMLAFAVFVGSSDRAPSLWGFLKWMRHSMADLFSFSSPAPDFLPSTFLQYGSQDTGSLWGLHLIPGLFIHRCCIKHWWCWMSYCFRFFLLHVADTPAISHSEFCVCVTSSKLHEIYLKLP